MLNFETFSAVIELYGNYAAALDNNEMDKWPDLFVEDCIYKLQPRENFDRGHPLCTLSFESRGMLKDRLYGATETIYHDPYYQRHVIGLPRITKVDGDRIHCEANYSVFRTKPSELSSVYNVGRYIDVIRRTPEGLRFESKLCIFDSETIPNSIIYPI